MPLNRDSRLEKKIKAYLRAKFRLEQRMQAIDHDEDVVIPIMEALKSGKPVLGIPAGLALDLELVKDDVVIGEGSDPDHSTGTE